MSSKACMTADCNDPRVDEFDFCYRHLSEPRRCAAKRRSTGERCKRPARRGLRFCDSHGGPKKYSERRSTKAKALTDMEKFVVPYKGDLDPISVFEAEFRRTYGRILWYDEQLARLASAEDLIWGLTKVEQIHAAETPGTNRTYEARVNLYHELQFKERRHLLDLEKVWLNANLDREKLNLMRKYVERSYSVMVEALQRLGIDPGAQEVRDVLRSVLLGEEEPRAALEAPERP